MVTFSSRSEILASFCMPLLYHMSDTLAQLDIHLRRVDNFSNNDWEINNNGRQLAIGIIRNQIEDFFTQYGNLYDEQVKEKAFALFNY